MRNFSYAEADLPAALAEMAKSMDTTSLALPLSLEECFGLDGEFCTGFNPGLAPSPCCFLFCCNRILTCCFGFSLMLFVWSWTDNGK